MDCTLCAKRFGRLREVGPVVRHATADANCWNKSPLSPTESSGMRVSFHRVCVSYHALTEITRRSICALAYPD